MDAIVWILLGIVVIVVVAIIGVYNGLIRARNEVDTAWSNIDAVLKKRFDLIPNLVETVKGYASHESGIFEEVARARSGYMNAQNPAQAAAAEGMLSGALKSLFAVAENYPDLKANENFLDLQRQLSALEDQINRSRTDFNETVKSYNNKLQVFPNNIIGGLFQFKEREFYELENAAERENVKVSFSS